ncbi:MAG: GntR family transcriptional regulator [Desulfarculaceae bacterium]|jgi:DNA-binding GntR family transcriptional regulator
MATPIKIQRRPLGEQVTDLVRRMILKGEVAAGERLVEERLAERLGTSRTPIREALHRLAQENLVLKRNKGGYMVRPFSPREIEEVMGVRAALESYAVERAAKRMSPDLLKRLEDNVDKFAAALKQRNSKQLVELNTTFHEIIYNAADSEMLTRMINDLAEVLHRFRVALMGEPQAAARSLSDHRRMLQALHKGKDQEAAQVCREHLKAGRLWMLARMQKDSEEND